MACGVRLKGSGGAKTKGWRGSAGKMVPKLVAGKFMGYAPYMRWA